MVSEWTTPGSRTTIPISTTNHHHRTTSFRAGPSSTSRTVARTEMVAQNCTNIAMRLTTSITAAARTAARSARPTCAGRDRLRLLDEAAFKHAKFFPFSNI